MGRTGRIRDKNVELAAIFVIDKLYKESSLLFRADIDSQAFNCASAALCAVNHLLYFRDRLVDIFGLAGADNHSTSFFCHLCSDGQTDASSGCSHKAYFAFISSHLMFLINDIF